MKPSLDQLGFAPSEQYACQLDRGIPLVAATIAGEEVLLAIETAMIVQLALSLPYAQARGFHLEAETHIATGVAGTVPSRRAFAIVPHVRVLGRDDWPGSIYAVESRRWSRVATDGRPIVGGIGMEFFQGCSLALDIRAGRLAFSDRPLNAVIPAPERIPLLRVENSVHAATAALGLDLFLQGNKPVLRVDSGAEHSVLTRDYIRENVGAFRFLLRVLLWAMQRALRVRRPFEFALTLPSGHEMCLPFHLVRSLATQARQLNIERVDGWLGAALFADSLAVLDLNNDELLLWSDRSQSVGREA
jgi:hypothetical protein